MRFLVDECTGPTVAKWLVAAGHDVVSVSPDKKGISDREVLEMAVKEERVLITNDKDFGELIFKEKLSHRGVIFLRISDETPKNKISILENVIQNHQELIGQLRFIVVTEKSIRSMG